MAASSNDSFGLKIATSFSIALTVVLLVAVYFLNSYYNPGVREELPLAQKKISELKRYHPRPSPTRPMIYKGSLIGYQGIEDYETAKAARSRRTRTRSSSRLQDIQKEIAGIGRRVQEEDRGQGGRRDSQFEALKQRGRELVDNSVANNSDPSYKAAIARLKDLTVNQAKLSTTALALNYIDLRRDLELANTVNADQKKVVEDRLRHRQGRTRRHDQEGRGRAVQPGQDHPRPGRQNTSPSLEVKP